MYNCCLVPVFANFHSVSSFYSPNFIDKLIRIRGAGFVFSIFSANESTNLKLIERIIENGNTVLLGTSVEHNRMNENKINKNLSVLKKKLSMELGRARNKILTDEGREPSVIELAEICGISIEDAAIALEAVNPISSLSETYGDDEKLTLESQLASDDHEIERLNDKLALSQAISKLPFDWRRIITLRYFRNMTQQQVADALGLSQVKVSREEKKILAFLKGELMV